jgi:hypothetical protein
MGRLLNEKVKPARVDLHQARGFLGHGIGCARSIIDQRHLAKQRAWARSLQHKIAEENVDFPVLHNVYLVALLAFAEKEIARGELQRVSLLTEKFGGIHRPWQINCPHLIEGSCDDYQVTIV